MVLSAESLVKLGQTLIRNRFSEIRIVNRTLRKTRIESCKPKFCKNVLKEFFLYKSSCNKRVSLSSIVKHEFIFIKTLFCACLLRMLYILSGKKETMTVAIK